jgi:hypothetical protein
MYCGAVDSCFVGGTTTVTTGSNTHQHAELYETVDGGMTWTSSLSVSLVAPNTYPAFTDMSCMSASRCIVVGEDQDPTAAFPSELIYLTNDAGATWTPMTVPTASAEFGLFSIDCNTSVHCLAVGVSSAAGNPLGGASLVAVSLSSGGVASSTLEGVTVSGHGGADGVDSVIQAQYGVTPVGSLPGAVSFFDAALSQGNSFSSVKVKVCSPDVTPNSAVSWWNPSSNAGAGGWATIVSDQGLVYDTSGPVPCLDATIDGASVPSITQLSGTVVGVHPLAHGSVALHSSHLAVAPLSSVTYTALVVGKTRSTPTGRVTFTDGGDSMGTSCTRVPLRGGVASCKVRYAVAGTHHVIAKYLGTSGTPAARSAALTEYVGHAPTIASEPGSKDATVGSAVTLTAMAKSRTTVTVQWDVSSDGMTFTPIVGATKSSYSFTETAALQGKRYYHAVFRNALGRVISKTATVTGT